ncbi:MAG: serine hydrolase [Bacteroidota bacterium]
MRLRFNHLNLLVYFGFLFLMTACSDQEQAKVPKAVPYLQVAHPVSDSLIQFLDLEQATQLMVWPKQSSLTDSLLHQYPNIRFGAIVDDYLHASVHPQEKIPSLFKVHVQGSTVVAPWLSEQSLNACAFTAARTDYLQQRTLELQRQSVIIDLDKSLLLGAHQPAIFTALLQDIEERQRNVLPFHQLVGLSGISHTFPEADSSQLPHPAIQDELRRLCQDGLPVIKLSEQRFRQLQSSVAPDSFHVFLRDSLQFQGLLCMELDLPNLPNEAQLLKYLSAGVQVFIAPKAIESLLSTLGKISRKEKNTLLAAAYEQLKMAEWAGLVGQSAPSPASNFIQRDSLAKLVLNRQLQRQSICLAMDYDGHIPVSNKHLDRLFLLTIGKHRPAAFIQQARGYSNPGLLHFYEPETADLKRSDRPYYTHLVLGIFDTPLDTCDHKSLIEAIEAAAEQKRVSIVNFGQPENIDHFSDKVSFLQVFSLEAQAETLAAQALFGGQAIQGQWPSTGSTNIAFGAGLLREKVTRLGYSLPQELGIHGQLQETVDAIVRQAIYSGAMPGCQVLIAKDGQVILNESYGHHTYDRRQRVKPQDLYDLASISKVAGTTLGAMLLYQQGAFLLQDSLEQHFDLPDESTIDHIQIRDLFTHQSGLQANMPILPYITYRTEDIQQYDRYFCWDDQQDFGIEVAADFFLQQEYIDSMRQAVYSLPVDTTQGYLYSDVNFCLLQELVEYKSMSSLDLFLYENLYQPLSLRHMIYQPLKRFDANDIVPTEVDNYWRMQLLDGHVHDESAALLGGVAGNAGLFGNAQDLATLFQLLLNNGQYGDAQMLQPGTIKRFTSTQKNSTRGLGFDKQKINGTAGCARSASMNTFGHTGFTGTCVWADPDHGLLFVFLSNRVHPSRKKRGLYQMRVREHLHQAVYDAIETYPPPQKALDEQPGLSLLNAPGR